MKKRNFKLYCSLALIVLIVLLALFAPLLPYDPNAIDISNKFAPSSLTHLLGTDHLGRDVFTRLIYGARLSLFAVVLIFACILSFSFVVGFVAGYKGGFWDKILMRVCDVFFAFPTFILALFFIAIFGIGLVNVILAIALTHWAWYARMIRSLVLEQKNQGFVLASKALGTSDIKVICRHILPFVLSQISVLITLDIGHMLLHIAGLSFLGLGVQAPNAEWGVMISDAAPFVMSEPQLMLYAGLAIFISVAAFNLLGEALQERGQR
ncbi:nickel ABC transporter permease subunit NikC [Campylobacter sp. MIT 12-5580]|uniref:nickel ABC transporter permease subunit NikC n=1 Tax=Campylobacter sp. MIT 12-5580 TaxID=2040651 RepID=UPI0010F43B36|nr:nickel ABC transporter permease subunit NikC [Campylobacter sp. MIT 12-5580]TKX29687.1 nickel ABC transporter permease subunit NikC [Campylobacter sp. MIT 12-5580]